LLRELFERVVRGSGHLSASRKSGEKTSIVLVPNQLTAPAPLSGFIGTVATSFLAFDNAGNSFSGNGPSFVINPSPKAGIGSKTALRLPRGC
jgi:hypothetical protein